MKILVAEDDAVLRRVLQALLSRWGFEPVPVADGYAALAVAEGPDAPRIALLDWMMPGVDGIEVCRRIRARAGETYTYVILATSRDRKADVIAGLDAGADDYLIKPFEQAELQVRLKSAQRILDLESALLETREQLMAQARHDGLTGHYNRQAVWELLEHEINRTRRSDTSLAVMMIDVDRFKVVNDTFGHLVGDAVLCETAHRLRVALRDFDVLGRYGGEEFLVVAPACGPVGARELGERLRIAVAASAIPCDPVTLPITVSVGVAAFERLPPEASPEAIVALADAAMYEAKQAGRNRVHVICPTDCPGSRERYNAAAFTASQSRSGLEAGLHRGDAQAPSSAGT